MTDSRKILLIDDEQIMHDLALAYLEKAGYQLISAYNGKSGLQQLLLERPDVVLLDFMMPGMNGEQVYEQVRRDPLYRDVRDTPVILLTAKGGDHDLKERLIKKGLVAYLQKPFGLRELSNIIDNIFIVNDIRKANRKLWREVRVTRDFLIQILQKAPVGILATNSAGELIQANPLIQSLFPAHTIDDLIRKNVFETAPFKASFIADGVRYVLEQAREWRREQIKWLFPKGDYAILTAHFVPILWGGSGVDGVIGLIEDVSFRERHNYEMQILAQIALAMQETTSLDQLLHVILTSITAGQALEFTRAMIFLLDQSGQTLQGTMAVGPKDRADAHQIWTSLEKENLTFEEFLHKYGYNLPVADDYLNNLVRSISVPANDPAQLLRTIAEKKPFRPAGIEKMENVLPKAFEALKLHDFIAVPLVSGNRLLGMIISDNKFGRAPIIERHMRLLLLVAGQAASAIERARAYEELEREKAKLEQALQELNVVNERLIQSERLAAIGEMAAHVAHEIRNPLVTIGGFARQMKKKATSSPALQESADIIAEEVIRLENILENVLNFTRLPRPNPQENDLNALILQIGEQVQYEMSQQGIEIISNLHKDVPKFEFDQEQIKQVLFNLLRNSQQSMPEGGTIAIETYLDGKDALVTVSDNGSGIPSDALEMIFNPFYTTKEHGTGLGLAISQRIIHEHGGDIKVFSEVNKGTVFKIHLPLETPGSGVVEQKRQQESLAAALL